LILFNAGVRHDAHARAEKRRAFDLASSWNIIRMRFPWQPQDYQRTCTECGYIWRVPRWAARRRVRSVSMISVASRTTIDRGELARKVESASASNRQADTFQRCPKCGADHFTQRALRGKSPD